MIVSVEKNSSRRIWSQAPYKNRSEKISFVNVAYIFAKYLNLSSLLVGDIKLGTIRECKLNSSFRDALLFGLENCVL